MSNKSPSKQSKAGKEGPFAATRSKSKDSVVTVLAERFIERPGHRFPVHHYKWENAKGYAQLKEFGCLFDVIGDGNCGYYAFMVSFIWVVLIGVPATLYRIYFPEIGSVEQDSGNNSNFAFAIRMRQSLRRCLQLNHVELTTRGKWTLFLNEDNRVIRVIGDSISIDDPNGDAGFSHNVRKDRNGRLCSEFTYQLESVFDPLHFKNKVMSYVTSKYYLNATSLMPIITMKYGQSIFFYYLNRDNNKYYTRLYFYRPDDRVQIFTDRLGWYPPFRGALAIYYNGSNHYEAVQIHPDFDEYSPRPTLASGEDESVVYDMTQFGTGDVSDAGDCADVPVNSADADDDGDSITSRFSLADHLTMTETFTNKAKQHVSVKRSIFDQLISCSWNDHAIGWTLVGLSWKETKNRSATISRQLSKLEPFKSHYVARSKGGARISAQFDKSLKRKKTNPTRAPHGLDIYFDGRCAQNSKNSFCTSTFVAGFKATDIEDMFSRNGTDINLHVVITNDCRHHLGKQESDVDMEISTVEETSQDIVKFDTNPVMYENALFHHLPSMLQKLHNDWDLLDCPRQLPKAKSDLIDRFIEKCEDEKFSKQFCTTSSTFMDMLTLTDDELNGEPVDSEQLMYEVIHERKILGVNFHPDCRAINSNFCCALKLKQDGSDLVDELNGMLPKEAWPEKEETAESLLKKSEECMWYDEEWRSRGTTKPINGLHSNRQAYRRTMSVAHGMCPVPLTNPQNEQELNRGVSSLYCYTCRESPVEMISCRPGTNGYFKVVLIIWRACWPRLRRVSRRSPFNAWQVMVYHPKLDKKINWHRDNYTVDAVKRMSNGEMPLREGAGWGGLMNSQQLGSDVVVFSYGNCPMRMCFKVMNSQGGSSQKSDDYEVEPTFMFELLGGYISILDGVSDAIMMHRLTFEGLKLEGDETKTVRAALVMRRLTNLQEFYADTSTLRVTKDVVIKGRKMVKAKHPRSIWS